MSEDLNLNLTAIRHCPQKRLSVCLWDLVRTLALILNVNHGEAPPSGKEVYVIMHMFWEKIVTKSLRFCHSFSLSGRKRMIKILLFCKRRRLFVIASERSIVCTIGFIYFQFCCPGTRGDILLRRGLSNRPLMLLIRKLFL